MLVLLRRFLRRFARYTFLKMPDSGEHAVENEGSRSALASVNELIASSPTDAAAWYRRGNLLRKLGESAESLVSFQRAIELNAVYATALCNCGSLLLSLGRLREASELLERAVLCDPTDPISYYNLAVTRHQLGDPDSARRAFDKAIQLDSEYALAYYARALLSENEGDWSSSLHDLDSALAISDAMPEAHFHRGNVLAMLGRWNDALQSFELAIQEAPQSGVAELHRGNVLRELEKWRDALESYERVIGLDPRSADAYYNRGVLLEQLRRIPEALEDFDRAIEIQPAFPQAQHNRALALLLQGDFERGLPAYEWRWKNRTPNVNPVTYRGEVPTWTGAESLRDKRILVFSEQGLGDTLQFCRYLKLLAHLGADILFEVQEPLRDLLAGLDGVSKIVGRDEPVPDHDYKIALLSLPLVLGTSFQSIPSEEHYLVADPNRVEQWQERIGPRVRPRIGIAWSGNPSAPHDRYRSMPLATLARRLPSGFDYFCLQSEVRKEDQKILSESGIRAGNPAGFAKTAAVCASMDVVITVCTSIAHLAGALGRPTWIMLGFNADWRWFLDRRDSPWYPTAVLHRQPAFGGWDAVVDSVIEDLNQLRR